MATFDREKEEEAIEVELYELLKNYCHPTVIQAAHASLLTLMRRLKMEEQEEEDKKTTTGREESGHEASLRRENFTLLQTVARLEGQLKTVLQQADQLRPSLANNAGSFLLTDDDMETEDVKLRDLQAENAALKDKIKQLESQGHLKNLTASDEAPPPNADFLQKLVATRSQLERSFDDCQTELRTERQRARSLERELTLLKQEVKDAYLRLDANALMIQYLRQLVDNALLGRSDDATGDSSKQQHDLSRLLNDYDRHEDWVREIKSQYNTLLFYCQEQELYGKRLKESVAMLAEERDAAVLQAAELRARVQQLDVRNQEQQLGDYQRDLQAHDEHMRVVELERRVVEMQDRAARFEDLEASFGRLLTQNQDLEEQLLQAELRERQAKAHVKRADKMVERVVHLEKLNDEYSKEIERLNDIVDRMQSYLEPTSSSTADFIHELELQKNHHHIHRPSSLHEDDDSTITSKQQPQLSNGKTTTQSSADAPDINLSPLSSTMLHSPTNYGGRQHNDGSKEKPSTSRFLEPLANARPRTPSFNDSIEIFDSRHPTVNLHKPSSSTDKHGNVLHAEDSYMDLDVLPTLNKISRNHQELIKSLSLTTGTHKRGPNTGDASSQENTIMLTRDQIDLLLADNERMRDLIDWLKRRSSNQSQGQGHHQLSPGKSSFREQTTY